MKKNKLLLIDDNVDMLLIGKRIFGRADYDFYTARNGQEGLETAKFHKPDVIVLDFILPDINGMQFIKILSTSQQYTAIRNIPIIILTAVHDVKKVPYRFAPDEDYLPVDVFLDKPTELDALIDIIREVLGERREEPEHPL